MHRNGEIYCNKCKKQINSNQGMNREEFLRVEKVWGYFSGKDNRVDRFDLCEECYDALIESFCVTIQQV